jgi:uncharacterized protein with ATP-grasp and redox domains
MKAESICLPCIVDDLRAAVDSEIADENLRHTIVRDALHYLADNFSTALPAPTFITGVHRVFKRASGIDTPFALRRAKCNTVGTSLARELKHRATTIRGLARFTFYVRWAIAGNKLDFRTVGTGYDFDVARIEAMLESGAQELAVDCTDELYREVRRNPRVFYVHDNVGEIALDALLIDEMKSLGAYVVSGVRGGPITSDATMKDAKSVGLDSVSDELVLVGPDTLGLSFDEATDKCREELQKADLVIAKGQANYCMFTEDSPLVRGKVACLFRTKCDLVAGVFGGRGHISIATFL